MQLGLDLFAPTSLSVVHPVNRSASPDSAKDWMTRVATSFSPLERLLRDTGPAGWCGRTSPASFPVEEDETLRAFWDSSQASASIPPPKAGQTRESSPASPAPTASHGACLTLNLPEWNHTLTPSRSGDAVCSLSDILETGDVPQRFYLSAKACAGILRRADKRGKELPRQLAHALAAVANSGRTSISMEG